MTPQLVLVEASLWSCSADLRTRLPAFIAIFLVSQTIGKSLFVHT